MPEPLVELTQAEWAIIKTVWAREPCAAPDVQETLHADTRWTYSTVRTLMDRMVAKGLLTAEKVRHLTLYRSAVTREQAQRGELLYTLKHAFDGALTPMVQCLLDTDELTAKEVAQIEAIIKAKKRSAALLNTSMKVRFMVLLLWSACGLVLAQASDDNERVKVVTKSSGREVTATSTLESTPLNLTVKFVRLPGAEAASFWRAVSPADRPAGQHWIVCLSEPEARKHVAKWMATVGTSDLAQFSVTTLSDRTFETSRATGSSKARQVSSGGEPLAFLRVTPTIDSNDGRRVHLELSAGITNSISALHQLRRFSALVTLWDGQTAVIGNPLDELGRPAEATTDPALLLVVSPVIVSGRD